jgi:hypothetical protein
MVWGGVHRRYARMYVETRMYASIAQYVCTYVRRQLACMRARMCVHVQRQAIRVAGPPTYGTPCPTNNDARALAEVCPRARPSVRRSVHHHHSSLFSVYPFTYLVVCIDRYMRTYVHSRSSHAYIHASIDRRQYTNNERTSIYAQKRKQSMYGDLLFTPLFVPFP